MERYVFIHGSSVGQSAFVPAGAPEPICNDIAVKYFQGRTLRQKKSAARKAMFVDLYNGSQGIYSVYSFVNNACFGANGREGQYFAISILCKGAYIYPESIYSMLSSAYDTIFKNGKILRGIENGECQYVISQFSEQKDYLAAFLKKVEEAFDKLVSGEGKAISPNVSTADYDSWRGDKVSLDVCNSTSALKALREVGRLYVSEEYESASVTINTLRAQVQRLQAEKTEIETNHMEAKRSQKSKERDEIEELNSQVRQKDIEINTLQKENENYEASINAVRKELDKYAKVGKAVADFQNKRSQSQSKGWQDMLKWCLLILIFVLTLFTALANFGFFRYISLLPEEEQTGEIKEVVGSASSDTEQSSLEFTIKPSKTSFTAEGGTQDLRMSTDNWKLPQSSVEWITFNRKDSITMAVIVSPNDAEERSSTFTINDIQCKVVQDGVQPNYSGDYSMEIKRGNEILSDNSQVFQDDNLNVSISGGTGNTTWAFENCTTDSNLSWRQISIKVTGDPSEDIVITYGIPGDPQKLQSRRLLIGNK